MNIVSSDELLRAMLTVRRYFEQAYDRPVKSFTVTLTKPKKPEKLEPSAQILGKPLYLKWEKPDA